MNKHHILAEIKRTAQENGGVPLGLDRFSQETGVKYDDWFGKYWARWSDAVKEAGFSPNKFVTEGCGEDVLIEKYAGLVRELGRVPVRGEIGLKRRTDKFFPSDKTFRQRFGSKAQLLTKLRGHCSKNSFLTDILPLIPSVVSPEVDEDEPAYCDKRGSEGGGSVYLIKAGRYYKIGKTNAIGRREYELAIQLPEKARTVYVIKAIDDASGIEAYWHKRFEAKRANGEWFELDSADVQAFKRRKLM
jgi:hypothetical protein